MTTRYAWILWVFASSFAAGCGGALPEDVEVDPSDYETVLEESKVDGVPSSFNRNLIMEESFFLNEKSVTAADVQSFFETGPYAKRSWLADHEMGEVSVADAIITVALAHEINPIVLLARMQAESGLISRTTKPSQKKIDYAFGCGCADGQDCNTAYKGIDKQLTCAADHLVELYNASVYESGLWVKGVAKKTLDPLTVTPANHVTASAYAYTPWVLEKQGGNWLVWNVTKRYANYFDSVK